MPSLGYRSQLSAAFGGSQRGAFRLANLTDKKTTTTSELNLKKKQATQSGNNLVGDIINNQRKCIQLNHLNPSSRAG